MMKKIDDKKLIFFVLLFANVVSTSVINICIPSLPQLVEDLCVSSILAQGTIGLHMFGSFLGRIFWGPLSDVYGRRFILLRGLAISIIGLIGCCLAPNIYFLFVFRAVQAIGSGVILIISMVIISDLTSGAKRTRTLGFIEISWPISWICAPIIGSFLCAIGGWRINFLFLLIMQSASFLMIYFFVPETLKVRSSNWSAKDVLSKYRSLLTNFSFITYALMPGFILSGYMLFAVVSPFIYTVNFKFTIQEFAFIQSLPLLLSFCMTLTYRVVVKKFGEKFSLRLGICFYAMFALLNILMISDIIIIEPYTLLFTVCIQCLGSACLIPASSSLALNQVPANNSGTAASIISLMRNLVLSFCLTLGGMISASESPKHLLISISTTVVVVFTLFALRTVTFHNNSLSLSSKNNK